MIQTETRYVTEDGAVFYNIARAKQHERMLRVMEKIRNAVDGDDDLAVKIYNAIASELRDA